MGLCNSCGKGGQVLCYKDRGFCIHSDKCEVLKCYRKVTDVIRKGAERSGLPLAFSDFNYGCYRGIQSCIKNVI